MLSEAQAVQAAQITFEDYFMADLAIEPLQIVGWEGIFGTFFMVAILLPIVSVTPGQDGSGFHEDTLESLHVRAHALAANFLLPLHCLHATRRAAPEQTCLHTLSGLTWNPEAAFRCADSSLRACRWL